VSWIQDMHLCMTGVCKIEHFSISQLIFSNMFTCKTIIYCHILLKDT
jgi:hypothetical protein